MHIRDIFKDSEVIIKCLENNSEIVLLDSTYNLVENYLWNCGWIMIDDGWLRLLWNNKVWRSIKNWNIWKLEKMILIWDDVIWWFFWINQWYFKDWILNIWYFAPDSLQRENLWFQYGDFLKWISAWWLNQFYIDYKRRDYKDFVKNVDFDSWILFYPFLFSEYDNVYNLSKKIVPIQELWDMNMNFKNQLDNNL